MLWQHMRALVFSLLLATASFAQTPPTITQIKPAVGFSYGGTRVTIVGDGFAAGEIKVFCPVPPPGGTGLGTCPAKVFVGGVEAYVHSVTQTEIIATIVPSILGQPRTGRADVRVLIEGRGEVTKTNGFVFDAFAMPGADNYVPFLLPLASDEVPGANGSVWKTTFRVFNPTAHALLLVAPYFSGFGARSGVTTHLTPPLLPYIPSRETHELHIDRPQLRQGAFVWAPKPLAAGTMMSLRVRDISRNAQGYGTELPIVPQNEFRTMQTLIDIPTDARYRATLRIYHWSEAGGLPSRVTISNQHTDVPVKTLDLVSSGQLSGEEFMRHPGYVEIDLLTPDVRAAGPHLRVEVDNVSALVSPPLPHLWAFVSITDNVTQQVTLVTPAEPLP